MSQENVEIVRRAFKAHQRRDDDTIFSLYDPAIEIEDDPTVPWPTHYCGLKGLKDFFRDWMAVFPLCVAGRAALGGPSAPHEAAG